MQELMTRPTIEQIVQTANDAIRLYEIAYDDIAKAEKSVRRAHEMVARCHPGTNNYCYSQADEINAFRSAVCLPQRESYLRTARRLTEIGAWSWIIERTDLERLMDTEAKDKLRNQMRYIPERTNSDGALINEDEIAKGMPALTVDNVVATLEQFALDADTIFRRSIANVFSRLDRRFRSHDGFKIGSRIIVTRMFDGDSGHLRYGRTRDMLIDVERVFSILDGQDEASFTSTLYAIDHDRQHIWSPCQTETETEYFKIRGFKNGNAHFWFKRADLVVKVNKLLAEYYGEVIADGQQKEEDPFANIKTTPARYFGFYPTPERAADIVLRNFPILQPSDRPQLRILEPSAGTGNLARRCVRRLDGTDNDLPAHWKDLYRYDNQVDCVEIQPHLADALAAEGIYNRIFNLDFLQLSPETTGHYDRIVMNPPFDRERDIDHVMHALAFLKENGCLTAIMSAGTEFRETKKASAFRELMNKMNAEWRDLPSGSFSEVGTNVNTLYVKVWKNGMPRYP